MKTAGLSLDQAPPIWIPFGFFLLAPLFLAAAAGLLAWQGDAVLLSRWTPSALALTHLLALGFLTQVMCGALLQMLPVLAGSPVPAVVLVGRATQLLLALGCLALCWGLYSGDRTSLSAGGLGLGAAVVIFAAASGLALLRGRGVPQTLQAMRLAVGAFLVTSALGLMLLAALLGAPLPDLAAWVSLHLGWGLLGWAGMLIMGVGYQVVPMFYVTPSYPRWLTRGGAPLVAASLSMATLLLVLGLDSLMRWAFGVGVASFVVFAVVTLERQRRRERPRVDATLLYWWSSMLLSMVAAAAWLLDAPAELVGLLALVGVGVGLPTGMLFKIMPFLSWFHLQHRQVAGRRFDVRLPHMQAFLPDAQAKVQLGLFWVGLSLLIGAAAVRPGPWMAVLSHAGGVALVAAAALLWWLQVRCYLTYRRFSRELA